MPYKVVKRAPRRKMMKRKQVKKTASVSPIVKQYVKRILSIRQEDKLTANVSQTLTTSIPMSPTLLNPINLANVWNITQGSAQGNRIGNSVSPKSWRVKGYFTNPWNATNPGYPFIIKIYIFKQKTSYGAPTASTSFYQNGSSSVAPAGTYGDLMRQVNLDVFTLYTTRTLKLGPSAPGALGSSLTANNDFKMVTPFSINCLKYQNHVMKYADGAISNPTNAGLYMAYTITNGDGSVPTTILPALAFEIEASYEDA